VAIIDLAALLALAAIWGGSFIFMRFLAPLLGPVTTTGGRVLIAGLVLWAVYAATGFKLEWRRNWRRYLVLGVLNSGLPFLLYAFAALHIPASLSVVLNALAPMFGAVFSAIWLADRLTWRKLAGLGLGILGVSLVSSLDRVSASPWALTGMAACVLATICYGLSTVYIRKRAMDVKPRALAGGSQLMAGLVFLPLMAAVRPQAAPGAPVIAVEVAFGVLCSAVAFLLYYRLVARVGPTRTLLVTLLMPAFGMLWGFLILGESITWVRILGAAVILAGTYLVAYPPRAQRAVRTARTAAAGAAAVKPAAEAAPAPPAAESP
jgi:drug/metabolite transporter (DMT)-like permease